MDTENGNGNGSTERAFLRSSRIAPLEAIRRKVLIVGCGAIGSRAAELLIRLGVQEITLVDGDRVGEENLGPQGYKRADLGQAKVSALSSRLGAIMQDGAGITMIEGKAPQALSREAKSLEVWILTPDKIRAREDCFSVWRKQDKAKILIDARMTPETMEILTVTKPNLDWYRQTIFPPGEAYQEGCTRQSTVYCASVAAGLLVAQYKKAVLGQPHARRVELALGLMIMERS